MTVTSSVNGDELPENNNNETTNNEEVKSNDTPQEQTPVENKEIQANSEPIPATEKAAETPVEVKAPKEDEVLQKTKSEEKTEEVMIPLSEVEKIIGQKLSEFKGEFYQNMAFRGKDGFPLSFSNELDPTDPEDALEEPVVFFTFGSKYSFDHDPGSRPLRYSPTRKLIKFTYAYSYKTGQGRYDRKNIDVAVAKVYSKKLVKFMRSTSLNNIKYFENISRLNSIDATYQQRLSEISAVNSRLAPNELINKIKVLNENGGKIDITNDFAGMVHAVSAFEYEKAAAVKEVNRKEIAEKEHKTYVALNDNK